MDRIFGTDVDYIDYMISIGKFKAVKDKKS
jgi:hypothetical protein